MFTMRKTLVVMALSGAMAFGSTAALAGPGGAGGFGVGRLLRQVELNDKQEDQAFELVEQLRREHRADQKKMQNELDSVISELEGTAPSAPKLHAFADQRIDAIRKLAHKAVDGFLKIHATFNADQRAQLAKKLKRFARMKHLD